MNFFKYISAAIIVIFIIFAVVNKKPETKIVSENESVEKYLRENISNLSPVPPVLGGNWYVVSVILDIKNNSGTVIYEDGHIQEKRAFSYTADEQNIIQGLIID